ncbi:hypothetical protein Avbf_09246 [Armadillidium vulgare]|nr:hypothetical protein Avbf_09246 [Armadillidium vulgare]
MNSDNMFKVCHDIVANFFAVDPDVKLFTYELDHVGQVSIAGDIPGFAERKLITHADDLVYLSYDKKSSRLKLENEDDLKVREIFVNLWTNFAKTGNPTPSGSDFTWNEAIPESFQHLSLTTTPVMQEETFIYTNANFGHR